MSEHTHQQLGFIFAGEATSLRIARTDDVDLTAFGKIEVRFSTSWGVTLLCKEFLPADVQQSEATVDLTAVDTALFSGHGSVEAQIWGDDTTPLGDGWFEVRDVVECGE